jgi:serine/threonine protein kinase
VPEVTQAFTIFRALLDIPDEGRDSFIAKECANAPDVAIEVRRLLHQHRLAGSFLETPVSDDSQRRETLPLRRFMFQVGDTIANRFRIERLAGIGGMGEVYEAHDSQLRTQVAIKTLRGDLAPYSWMVQRFRHEVLRARLVAHPQVCKVYDLFAHILPDGSEVPFFTMQLLSGQTLAQWLLREGRMSPSTALPLLTDIAGALQAAHRLNIIHRDLNPKNIFICSGGERPRAVVTDFGLAVVADPADREEGTITRLFAGAGTPAYMAPEQKSMKPLSTATDVYALGLVAYEVTTATLPADDGSLDRLEELPASWQTSIQRCLRADPNERFSDPVEFIAALCAPSKPTQNVQLLEWIGGAHYKRTVVATILLILALVISTAAFLRWPSDRTQQARSIAVLPFETSDPDLAYLGEGLADELASTLTSLPDLRVAGRNSAFHFRDGTVPAPEIGRSLGVRLLLEGSVRRKADRLLVSVQLIDAASNRQLWSKPFDREFRQLFAIQSEIITETAARLGVVLPAQPTEREATKNMEAFDLYLKGRYFWNKRTEEGLHKGLQYLEESRKTDPSFAPAYTGIADSYTVLADYGWSSPGEVLVNAGEALRRSLELQPNLADTHASLGLFDALVVWDQRGAESAFQKALALKPSSMTAHFWYGGFLMRGRRLEEALKEARLAQSLDPVSPATVLFVAWVHYYKKDYVSAIAVSKEVLDLDPNYPHAHQLLALCNAALGHSADALKENELAVRETNDPAVRLRYRGQVLSLIPEKREEAYEIASRLAALSSDRQGGYLAVIYAALKDRDKMYEWIDRSINIRDSAILLANVASPMDPYRSDDRFRQALQTMGY